MTLYWHHQNDRALIMGSVNVSLIVRGKVWQRDSVYAPLLLKRNDGVSKREIEPLVDCLSAQPTPYRQAKPAHSWHCNVYGSEPHDSQ